MSDKRKYGGKTSVENIPIELIDDFPEHPFKVRDDSDMRELIESISRYGIINPVILRFKENGRYELISGHRRKYAGKRLGMWQIPAIVCEMSKEEAIISLVDSNLHRERILPSEKAVAYKMKLNAIKKQGRRTDLTSTPMAGKLKNKESAEMIGEESGESADQVRRYVRLTYLIPELLNMVDEGKIAFRPAVELSYLIEEEQRDLLETIDSEDRTPSLSQAIRMKKLSQEGVLDMDAIFGVMTEEKGNQKENIKISYERIGRFFPRGTPVKHMEDIIVRALMYYRQKNRDKKEER